MRLTDIATFAAAAASIGTVWFAYAQSRLMRQELNDAHDRQQKTDEALAHQIAAAERAAEAASHQSQILKAEREDFVSDQARRVTSQLLKVPGRAASPRLYFEIANRSDRKIQALCILGAWVEETNQPAPTKWAFLGFWTPEQISVDQLFIEPSESNALTQPGTLEGGLELIAGVAFFDADEKPVYIDTADKRAQATIDLQFVDDAGRRWERWAGVSPRLSVQSVVERNPPKALERIGEDDPYGLLDYAGNPDRRAEMQKVQDDGKSSCNSDPE